MKRDEIFQTVRRCIAESLAVPEQKIDLHSRLIDDLGADSLDFLDIIFTLEKEFSTKLRDPNLDLLIRADFSQDRSVGNGKLSAETIERLAQWLPALKETTPNEVTIRGLYSYITVKTLVTLVEQKIEV